MVYKVTEKWLLSAVVEAVEHTCSAVEAGEHACSVYWTKNYDQDIFNKLIIHTKLCIYWLKGHDHVDEHVRFSGYLPRIL